jgi:hypothetical protein
MSGQLYIPHAAIFLIVGAFLVRFFYLHFVLLGKGWVIAWVLIAAILSLFLCAVSWQDDQNAFAAFFTFCMTWVATAFIVGTGTVVRGLIKLSDFGKDFWKRYFMIKTH